MKPTEIFDWQLKRLQVLRASFPADAELLDTERERIANWHLDALEKSAVLPDAKNPHNCA